MSLYIPLSLLQNVMFQSAESGLKELQKGIKKLNEGKVKIMKFFCEDDNQCKLEELLQCIMKFVDHLSTCAQVSTQVECQQW